MIALRSFVAFATGYNTTVSPSGMPAGWQPGDALIFSTFDDQAAQTQSTGGGGTGGTYPLLSKNVNAQACNHWGRFAVSGDSVPSFSMSGSCNQACILSAWTGVGSMTPNVPTGGSAWDRANSSTQQILCQLSAPLTPTVPGCLILAGGCRVKTASGNGETANTLTNFTTLAESIPNGSTVAAILNYWIQTTAAAFGDHAQTTTIADTAGNTMASYIVLTPPVAANPMVPQPKKRRIFLPIFFPRS